MSVSEGLADGQRCAHPQPLPHWGEGAAASCLMESERETQSPGNSLTMPPTKSKERTAAPLRRQAELGVNGNTLRNGTANTKKLEMLIQNLETHQIELQTQNEESRRSHIETEEARHRYSDLYDFAPIGYFTLNTQGVILEANLTAAALLGVNRRGLVQRGLGRFVRGEDQKKICEFLPAGPGRGESADLRAETVEKQW